MEKYRFNLELTEQAKKQLDALQKRTDSASTVEVIRRALTVYDTLQKYTSEDWELLLRRKDGKEEKSVLLA